MSLWLQNLLVFLTVAGCAAFILFQLVGTLRSRGKLGSCCSKGCSRPPTDRQEKVFFLPADLLTLRRKP